MDDDLAEQRFQQQVEALISAGVERSDAEDVIDYIGPTSVAVGPPRGEDAS